jgi:hypothetical protein
MAEPWRGAFADYAAAHSEVGEAAGPIVYLPPDFVAAAQLSASHILLWTGQAPVVAVKRTAGGPPDPDLGTGQQLRDYLPDWDKPDDVVMAEKGVSQLMVWSVKNALRRGGLTLKFPAPPGSDAGWKVYPAGFPVPPDWRGGGG